MYPERKPPIGNPRKMPQAWKYEKKYKKIQIPHPGSGPENTTKTKITKMLACLKMAIFVIFVYFLYFPGPTWDEGFSVFFLGGGGVFFIVFPGSRHISGKLNGGY